MTYNNIWIIYGYNKCEEFFFLKVRVNTALDCSVLVSGLEPTLKPLHAHMYRPYLASGPAGPNEINVSSPPCCPVALLLPDTLHA